MDLCFLGVDVGISHLAVLIPGKGGGKKKCSFAEIGTRGGVKREGSKWPIDSHKEEARAHVVRGGTHPYVPMLLKVL